VSAPWIHILLWIQERRQSRQKVGGAGLEWRDSACYRVASEPFFAGGRTLRDDLTRLGVGKRLPDALYLHRDVAAELPTDVQELVGRAARQISGEQFDVIRVSAEGDRIGLLAYPTFWSEAFPVLAHSWTLAAGEEQAQYRDYRGHSNPPVLHRKELLIPAGHPRRKEFARLTAQAEAAGLFDDPTSIGLLMQWRETLRARGLRVRGHVLEPGILEDDDDQTRVHRHRTALRRKGLSSPMQALYRHSFLNGHYSLFDYGCGRGDDLSALEELGVAASGWDPHFRPEAPKLEADIVNLGFVLNVIEDLPERREALLGAYRLARRVLSISVLIGGRTAFERYRLFRDGVLTPKGTFQKYFTQEELRDYVDKSLGRQPVAVAPGIFFVFRDDCDEQSFLAARQSSRYIALPQLAQIAARKARQRVLREKKPTKWELHRPTLDRFFDACVALGRIPTPEEWGPPEDLRQVGHPKTVLKKLLAERGSERFLQSRRCRIDDLIVYLALNLFEHRKSFGALPPPVQRDVKDFWSSYANATTAAKALLFSLGSPENLVVAARVAANEHLGFLATDDAFFFHPSVLTRLPNELRVFVGCATRMCGEVEEADLVKVHSRTAKLSTMLYRDFDESPLPMLLERTKADLRRQELIFVDHADQRQLLFFKSRYLPEDYPCFAEQRAFDDTLQRADFLEFKGFGPTQPELELQLSDHGWHQDGFNLKPSAT
jgi:DNA phosphorothioation-associated putative methyltransferase